MQSRIITGKELPFDMISSQEFEELVLWIMIEQHSPISSYKMGRQGDKQYGKDLVLVFKEECYAIECKRYKKIYPRDVKKIFNNFRGQYSKRFLATSAVVSSNSRNLLKQNEIIIDGNDLSRILKTHWSIVACFFGTVIADLFCVSDTNLSKCLAHTGQDHYYRVINKAYIELDSCPANHFFDFQKQYQHSFNKSFPLHIREIFDTQEIKTIFPDTIDLFFPYHYCATLVILCFLKTELKLNISVNFLERTSKAIPLILSHEGRNVAIALSRTQYDNLLSLKTNSNSKINLIASLPYGTHELYLKHIESNGSTPIITLENSSQWNELQLTKMSIIKTLDLKLVPEKPTESKFLNGLEMDMGIISPWSFLWASNQQELVKIKYCITERFLVTNLISEKANIFGKLFYFAWLYLLENKQLVPPIILKYFPFKEIIQFCNLSENKIN